MQDTSLCDNIKLNIISKSCITFATDVKNVCRLQRQKHGDDYVTASMRCR